MKSLRYARNLRPYLNVNHENGTTVEIDTENDAALGITPPWVVMSGRIRRAAVSVPANVTLQHGIFIQRTLSIHTRSRC